MTVIIHGSIIYKQVSPYSLSEVYNSMNVFFCDGDFNSYIWNKYFIGTNLFRLLFEKYIKINDNVQNIIEPYLPNMSGRILGVHFRGKEMNYAPEHPFGHTKKQIFRYTDEILKKHRIDKILIVTEDKDYLDAFVERYHDKVFYTDSFCIAKINAYNIYPRENHKYLLGLEVLRDAILLSKCNVLLCGESNVSQVADLIGDNQITYLIDNGKNSSNHTIARYLYALKKRLPSRLGGLRNEMITRNKPIKI